MTTYSAIRVPQDTPGHDSPLLLTPEYEDLEGQIQSHEPQETPKYKKKLTIAIIAAVISALIAMAIIISVVSLGHKDTYTSDNSSNRSVILVSIDGFRPEYLNRGLTPTLRKLYDEEVSAERMIPQFPSKTFPNHYTMVTGLVPSANGMVGNHFWDPVYNDTFAIWLPGPPSDGKWWNGEPVWNSVSKSGKFSAVCFWPGSEAKINGRQPDIWLDYPKAANMTPNDRVDLVLSWYEQNRVPDFAALYFSEVDSVGHSTGVSSQALNDSLRKADVAIARLFDGLEKLGRSDKTNVIIVSDHGMTALDDKKVIPIYQVVDMNKVNVFDSTPIVHLWPKDSNDIEDLYKKLKDYSKTDTHFSVYKHDEIPKEYKYSDSRRIAPILLVAEEPYSFLTREGDTLLKATHGYDPFKYEDMSAIFIASGPDFKKQVRLPPFQNYEVYNLLAKLLDFIPEPNNGTLPLLPLLNTAIEK